MESQNGKHCAIKNRLFACTRGCGRKEMVTSKQPFSHLTFKKKRNETKTLEGRKGQSPCACDMNWTSPFKQGVRHSLSGQLADAIETITPLTGRKCGYFTHLHLWKWERLKYRMPKTQGRWSLKSGVWSSRWSTTLPFLEQGSAGAVATHSRV